MGTCFPTSPVFDECVNASGHQSHLFSYPATFVELQAGSDSLPLLLFCVSSLFLVAVVVLLSGVIFIVALLFWCHAVVVVTTAQLHSTKPELRFWAGSNPACGMSDSQW